MMMPICIKQHLSNIWTSIHEKVEVEKTEAELKKGIAYKKKACTFQTYAYFYYWFQHAASFSCFMHFYLS